ncbi:MAG: hypothetical protein SF070_02605 [Gemmatimonadota bacterium]|nr:hypothetical protein [Gemmatimonadota bacterium]
MSDGSAARRLGGSAVGTAAAPEREPTSRRAAESPPCNRCGFPVTIRPWGCKNPCANCGTVYPLGDCSD